MTRALRVFAVMACAAGLAWATTYVQLDVDAMLERADMAFLGDVVDVRVVERDGLPWTRVSFEVVRDLAAEAEAADDPEPLAEDVALRVELEFLGGALPGEPALAVALMPTFTVGERVLVLAHDEPHASPIVGFRQGLWRVDGDALADLEGRRLGLEDEALAVDGPPAPLDAVLDAFVARLGSAP